MTILNSYDLLGRKFGTHPVAELNWKSSEQVRFVCCLCGSLVPNLIPCVFGRDGQGRPPVPDLIHSLKIGRQLKINGLTPLSVPILIPRVHSV